MADTNQPTTGMTKRGFLKTCAVGAGALCLGREAGGATTPTGPGPAQTAQRGLIGMAPSPWYSALDNDRIRCELCPRLCELDEGRRGPCRVRGNRNGQCFTLVYGNPALVQMDPIERKPFFHMLPGTRSLSVSTAGCNLSCMFCEVWDMALVTPEDVHAYDLSPEDIIAQAREAGADSVSYAFGEPVVFIEYAMAIGALAKEAGLRSVVHTAGYIQPKPLDALCELVDAANIDLKGFDPDFYREVCGGELDPVLDTLKRLKKAGIHIELTNLIIPTLNDDMDDIRAMCAWIKDELGPGTPIHFSRFYPLYQLANLPPTPVSTLDEARETAFEAGLEYVYIANVTGHEGENTACPACNESIIKRLGFVVEEVHLSGGSCSHCGHEIPGIWA